MPSQRWNERFFASTRGQVVALLRQSSRTVNELAEQLGLTDNAVRSHLAGLERDGLIEQEGVRRGMGKPAILYRLTEQAEGLFPKAYSFVLGQLIASLKERMSEEELIDLLRSVGKRAAAGTDINGAFNVRLELALAILAEAGGDAVAEPVDPNTVRVRGYACPLGNVVLEHPEACRFTESLLSELVHAPVHEECERTGRPRCAFLIEAD